MRDERTKDDETLIFHGLNACTDSERVSEREKEEESGGVKRRSNGITAITWHHCRGRPSHPLSRLLLSSLSLTRPRHDAHAGTSMIAGSCISCMPDERAEASGGEQERREGERREEWQEIGTRIPIGMPWPGNALLMQMMWTVNYSDAKNGRREKM